MDGIGHGVAKIQTRLSDFFFLSSGGSAVKNLPEMQEPQETGFQSLVSGSGRSHGRRHGKPLQYSCLENPHGERSLVDYSPWGPKELDTTE